MAVQVVDEPPPSRFRVRRVNHGDPAEVEAELLAAADDGYEYREVLTQANGDVIVIFERRAAPAPPAEA